LFTPALTHSDVFYQRQLGSYNLCIYNAGQDDATMCFWVQTEGKRGADEVISCLHKFILANFDVLPENQNRTLTLWSDRCVGQNNNFHTVVYLHYLISSG